MSGRKLLIAALAAAALGACADSNDATSANASEKLAALTISLSPATVSVGQTSAASATGANLSGASIQAGTVAWTSTNPSVATVASTGVVTAVGVGTTSIAGSAQGITGQATLTVVGVNTAGATAISLSQAGQSAALVDSPNSVISLSATSGAQYLIAVVNTDNAPSMLEDFTLQGSAGAGAAGTSSSAIAAPRPAAASAPAQRTLSLSAATMAVLSRARAQNHMQMLEANRELFAARGSPKAAWSRSLSASRIAPMSASVIQTIGRVNRVYVKNNLTATCTSVDSIGARTVAIGQHIIVLADTNLTTWPQSLRPDSSFYQTFADEYDQLTYPHILANVGDPLAYDGSLSGTGKVTVTITPVLNNLKGVTGGGSIVAFVNGCDFFPYATTGDDADLSNQTEMFYSWVPSSNGDDVADWEKELRATAAHETKHLVSYTDRIVNNSPSFEEVWLEEGLAQESSEIWERNFNEATLGGNATFLETVACEINLGASAPCDAQNNKPLALVTSHLPFFFEYLQNESSTHSEGLGLDTPSNYGAGWAFARWATDQYGAGNEGAFIKSLVNEPNLTGLANLSVHTGQSPASLLVYWNLASAIFQTPTYTFADPRATTPSFNFADIFKVGQTGLTCSGTPCGLFSQSGTPVFPIQPIALTSGAIANTVTGVPGTSAIFYLLTSSSTGTQTLSLTTTSGTALPASSGLRMAILRVK